MREHEANRYRSFIWSSDGWMFVRVQPEDLERFCPLCVRQAKQFHAWMIHPPKNDPLCIDCYERGRRP
jgi:hypothetical protein